MKYLVAKINPDINKKICLDDPKNVEADNIEESKAMYCEVSGTDDDCKLVSYPIIDGIATISFQTDNFRNCYGKDVRGIAVEDLKKNKIYAGILLNVIKAGVAPTEDEILEYYYRNNHEKYVADINSAIDDAAVQLNLRRIRKAIPWDRYVVDTGYYNVIIPITSNFAIRSENTGVV